MPSFFDWLGPAMAVVFACLWLWTWWRCRKAEPALPHAALSDAVQREEAEDLLKVAYSLENLENPVSVAELARAARCSESVLRDGLAVLSAWAWIEMVAEDHLRLTEKGRCRAGELTRAHRLWERYLVEREGMSLDAVHAEAHHHEHAMTPDEIERLDAELEYPVWDPHGHVIPAPDSRLPVMSACSLLEQGQPGSRLKIVQLNDSSSELLSQLVALGLEPGVELEVRAREASRVLVRVNSHDVPLSNVAAQGIFVVPAPTLPVPLGELPIGSQARVAEVRGGGKHQRRMLDMGFVPGAEVIVVREAPLGDPVAYRVKDTLIALRKEDADTILVEEVGDA
ncbi:MAG: FeoA domain-containing protein [Anaerolineae bacterium]|nr:FeoA domain-containing protein [Anaerolineae bacterium]